MPKNAAGYWRPPAPPLPKLKELAYFGRYTARMATSMAAHRHDCLEICYIESGMAEWWVERQPYLVQGGRFILIRPHELHGGIDQVHQPCRYYYLGLRTNARSLLGLPRAEARRLVAAIDRLPTRCFQAPAQAARYFAAAFADIQTHTELSITNVRAALLQILLLAVSSGKTAKPIERSAVVRETIALIESNLEDPLRLDEVARRAGWSVSHLKTRFRREMGITPAEFYLRRRISRACAELRGSDEDITAIALRLGFASSQYFATAFKRTVGVTPREYRERYCSTWTKRSVH